MAILAIDRYDKLWERETARRWEVVARQTDGGGTVLMLSLTRFQVSCKNYAAPICAMSPNLHLFLYLVLRHLFCSREARNFGFKTLRNKQPNSEFHFCVIRNVHFPTFNIQGC